MFKSDSGEWNKAYFCHTFFFFLIEFYLPSPLKTMKQSEKQLMYVHTQPAMTRVAFQSHKPKNCWEPLRKA